MPAREPVTAARSILSSTGALGLQRESRLQRCHGAVIVAGHLDDASAVRDRLDDIDEPEESDRHVT